jgi:hypothetical protein
MRAAKFTIETLPNYVFDGFTEHEEWNGWACPHFTHEVGQKILQAHNLNGIKALFDEEVDQFVFEIEGEEECYPEVIREGKKLYPIGNGVWIWEEVQ